MLKRAFVNVTMSEVPDGLARLKELLKKSEITLFTDKIRLPDKVSPPDKVGLPDKVSPPDKVELPNKFGSTCKVEFHDLNSWDGKDSLCITDDVKLASELVERGWAVMAYIHSGNREKNFSCVRYAIEGFENLEPEYLVRVYQRVHGIPWNILNTTHCVVRETAVEDVEDFYRIYEEPSITEFMEGLFESREEETEYIRSYIEKIYGFYEFGMWTVTWKETGEIIGRAGLSMREGFDEPELGYLIARQWQGKGLATEVCRAILNYGRIELGFDTVQAMIEPDNIVSLYLCRKLGFIEAGEVIWKNQKYIRLIIDL